MRTVLLKRKLTSFQIIILGFSGVILFGTFLLMLPFSSRNGLATPFSDALFTSTLWESRKAASWSYLFLQTQC